MRRRMGLAMGMLSLLWLAQGSLGHAKDTEEKSIWITRTCAGADEKSPCLSTPVSKKSPLSWQAVLAPIAPGIRLNKDEEIVADKLTQPPSELKGVTCNYGEAVTFHEIQVYPAPNAYLALLNTEMCVILAKFRSEPPYQLVSSMTISDMGGPEMGGMAHYFIKIFEMSPQAILIDILSLHANSNESYANYLLILSTGDRLSLAYDGPRLYGFHTERESSVAWSMSMDLLHSSHGPYKDLSMDATEIIDQKTKRHYRWTIAWDGAKGKYMGGNLQLQKLVNAMTKEN